MQNSNSNPRAYVAALRAAAIDDADTLRKAGDSKALNVHAYALGIIESHLITALEENERLTAKLSAALEAPVKTTLSNRGRERVVEWKVVSLLTDIIDSGLFASAWNEMRFNNNEAGSAFPKALNEIRDVLECAFTECIDLADDWTEQYVNEHGHCPACPDAMSGSECENCGRKTADDDRRPFTSEADKERG